jgi:hypothetical protein
MNLENFQSLQFDEMPQITALSFEKAIERLVNLEYFAVRNCPKLLTNVLLQKVFHCMINLKTLVLADAEKVSF